VAPKRSTESVACVSEGGDAAPDGREAMSKFHVEVLSGDRRDALIRASIRVGMRLEYALQGRPAWTHLDADGNVTDASEPVVTFAPPWAEDPRTLTTLLARIDTCLAVQS
jgi:hypothetical protein